MSALDTYNRNLPALNGGLNGWFGRLIKNLTMRAMEAVRDIPIVGSVFKSEITQLQTWIKNQMDGEFFQRAAPDYEPTPAEAVLLENWSTTMLIPFYQALVTQLSDAYKIADPTLQLVQINSVLQKMCVVKNYFATNETAGLSADGVKSRLELITQIFLPVESMITKSIDDYDLVINLTPYNFLVTSTNGKSFAPLVPKLALGVTFTCNKYVATTTAKPTTKPGTTTPTNPVTSLPGTTTPGTTMPTKPVTTTPVVTNPDPGLPTETGDDKQDKNLWLWIVGLIAAGFTLNKILK